MTDQISKKQYDFNKKCILSKLLFIKEDIMNQEFVLDVLLKLTKEVILVIVDSKEESEV